MNQSELYGLNKAMIESSLADLNVAIPCTIKKVEGNKVDVVPAINRGPMIPSDSVERDYQETTVIEGIPVVNLNCGVFEINIPLMEGCKGLLIFSDYDIDEWMQGNPDPETARTHDLNDCFFFPSFNGGSNEVDCLQLKAGPTIVDVCVDGVKITGNLTVTGNSNVEGNLDVAGDADIDGTLTNNGGIEARGGCAGC